MKVRTLNIFYCSTEISNFDVYLKYINRPKSKIVINKKYPRPFYAFLSPVEADVSPGFDEDLGWGMKSSIVFWIGGG